MKKLLALLLLTAIISTGCSAAKDKPEDVSKPEDFKDTTSISSEPAEETAGSINPFTGETVSDAQSLLNRPLAVMINNIDQALPQSGIGTADIVFELPVEGSATRLMAVFADYTKMPKMGSIRSSRHDYVEIIKPFDPIYLHFGYSDAAKESIATNEIDNINGIQMSNLAFYQDKEKLKSKASEHTWFSTLEYLQKGIENKGYETTLQQKIEPMFKFAKDNAMATYTDAADMANVTVKYSNGVNATFDYNTETGLYSKTQNGKPHIDENIGDACAVKNVLVMYTNVGQIPNKTNKEIDLSQGTGYYFSEGKKIDVTFKKPSIDSYLKAYDKDGKELELNVGRTWFSIAPIEFKG